ncbi:hypothetical protein ACMFMF_010104 [Clarireedia jacksonii]
MAPKLTTAMDLDDPRDPSPQKEVREAPKLILFDTIILKGKSTPASVDDLSTGVPLRAEGHLWIEEPEKVRLHKPNGSECVVPFQLFSYERNDLGAITFWVLDTQTQYWIEMVPSQQYTDRYGQLIASAELKHFVTDYYLGVVDGEVEDDIMQLCWEFGREDGRGLRADDVMMVLKDDANSYFLLSQFRQEIYVDEETKKLKWTSTKLYKFLKKECSFSYKKAYGLISIPDTTSEEPSFVSPTPQSISPAPSHPIPITTHHPRATPHQLHQLSHLIPLLLSLFPSPGSNNKSRTPTPSLLSNKLYLSYRIPDNGASDGPRVAKCIIHLLSPILADILERDYSSLFLAPSPNAAFVQELRCMAQMRYPPPTKGVTDDGVWEGYLRVAEGMTLVPRVRKGGAGTGAGAGAGAGGGGGGGERKRAEVKDLFTNKPPVIMGRRRKAETTMGVGEGVGVGNKRKLREVETQVMDLDGEEEGTESKGEGDKDACADGEPVDMTTALRKLMKIGMRPEIIGGRVVPPRIRRSGY